MKFISLLLLLFPAAAWADKSTAFNIKYVQCSTNSATIEEADCGTNGQDPCEMGEHVSLSGYYKVSTSVPTSVEVCGKVQVFGVQVYKAGCDYVNVCDYVDCDSDSDVLDSNGSPYSYSVDVKIPGNSRWIGAGYRFGFVFDAYYEDSKVETCKVVVKATSISSSASIVALASLCATAAALYYRKKRRTGTIDLEKEESLVQTDFVELSKSGVSV